jgi:hypothetical protein
MTWHRYDFQWSQQLLWSRFWWFKCIEKESGDKSPHSKSPRLDLPA